MTEYIPSWHDACGAIGVTMIVVAYFLLQVERVSSSSAQYLLANAFGALLILVSLMYEFNLSAFMVEIFWFIISVIGLVRRKPKVGVEP